MALMSHSPRRGSLGAGALLIPAVCLVAANLRMTITAVGPLLDEIAADRGIAPAALGLLGSLPLLTWGLVSPLAHSLSARFGMSRAVSGSLVVLAIGTAWRSLPGAEANLWLGTACIGVGLAIANALLPAVIKRDFPARVPLMMGIYTALLGGTGAIGAGFAAPLADLTVNGERLGWQWTLALMGAPIPLALVVWIIATRAGRGAGIGLRGPADPSADGAAVPRQPEAAAGAGAPVVTAVPGTSAGRRIWRDPLAWQVSLYMGTQSAIFYSLSSWLAPYETSLGSSPVAAGALVMVFQIIGIGGSLALPLLARGARGTRWWPGLLPVGTLVALVGMALWPAAMLAWLAIGGLAGGGSLTMAMTLMAMRARTAEHSAALSGMAQSLGYLIAAAGPVAFGALLGASGGWIAPFALIWGAAVAQIALGVSVGRPRFVLGR